MAQTPRPQRLSVTDETGVARTLAAGPGTFAVFGHGDRPIFLGLGPDPAAAAGLVPGKRAAYLECPAFAAAMPPSWAAALPRGWQRLTPEELTPQRAAGATFYLYRQNPRLFPSFWGPLWARAQLALLPRPDRTAATPTVLVPQAPDGLLEPEIIRALTALGKTVAALPAASAASAVARALCGAKPELCLCVNAAGLDDDGLVFSLLEAAGVPVAIWFVDNPFHVLGRFRGPFWKKALLCATDDAFAAPLAALGARRFLHLPLAAAGHFFTARPEPELAGRAVFVGRSAFAGRDAFFAGCRTPRELADTARDMLARGERPDFSWWTARLAPGPLWPGKAARQAGCGAEAASLAHRAAVLAALSRDAPLTVFGDAGWDALLPVGMDRRGPVDYYGRLPGLYAGAGVTANVTSLLLPHGLTQRHFDVWAAGGCLITDATPGLSLFPAALTAPVTYATPSGAAGLARALLADPARRGELAAAWREHIRAGHRYGHRLRALLDRIRAG